MSVPQRICQGSPMGNARCGQRATVVCTGAAPDDVATVFHEQTFFALQWYACDDVKCHYGAMAFEPIAAFFTRIFKGIGVAAGAAEALDELAKLPALKRGGAS